MYTEIKPLRDGTIILSRDLEYFLNLLVPEGKLTRDDDMRNFLHSVFGGTWIDYDPPCKVRGYLNYDKYMQSIVSTVPFHRVVGSRGHVDREEHICKLRSEGHTIIPPKGKFGARVKDYKRCLYDFTQEAYINKEYLTRIHYEGLDFTGLLDR